MGLLVSIIVPIYNVEKYLVKCIESILNQTYKNIEIILVNDGSTDSSGFICSSFSTKYKNISLISQNNLGEGEARNTGLAVAQGEYILFTDSDDWLPIDAVQKHVKAIVDNDADLTIGFIKEYVYDKNEIIKKEIDHSNIRIPSNYNYDIKKILLSLPEQINLQSACNKMYLARLVHNFKLKFPNIHRGADVLFNNIYYEKIRKTFIIDDIVYNRRTIDEVIYSKDVGNLAESRLIVYQSYKDLLSYWNIQNIESEKFLKKTIFDVIWTYYKYVLNNNKLLANEKYRLLNDLNMQVLLNELKQNNIFPDLRGLKSKLLYQVIYYDLKPVLLAYGLLQKMH